MSHKVVDYLQLIRAPAVFTALSNIIAAQWIVNEGRVNWEAMSLLGITSLCLYVSGMILNDCFDYHEDCLERPGRPLPSGRVSRKLAWQLGWLLLAAGLGASALYGYKQLLIAFLLSACIVFYNAAAKKRMYGSLVMGACRYGNWLLGLSTAAFEVTHFLMAAPIFIYVSALTLLSTIETSASNKNLLVGCSIGMLMCALTIFYIQSRSPELSAIAFIALSGGGLFVFNRLHTTYQDFSPKQIQTTIKYLVMGIIPLDVLMVLSTTANASAIVLLFLMLPGWLLARSLRVT